MMPTKKSFEVVPALCMLAALMTGLLCSQIVPSEWLLDVLVWTFLVCLVVAAILFIRAEKEAPTDLTMTLVLTAVGLPEVKGKIRKRFFSWIFLIVFSFDVGMMAGACLLIYFNS